MGRPVVIFHGDKGGVGKSTAARAFLHWTLEREIDCSAVEMDARNPDLFRTYQRVRNVTLLNVRQKAAWMELVDLLAERPEMVVVDFPAGAGGEMSEFGPPLLDALTDLGRPLWIFWMINRGKSGLRALSATLDDLAGHPLKLVVVKNGFYGEEERFERYSEHAVAEKVADAKGTVAYFPNLQDTVFDAVDDANLAFDEALAGTEEFKLRYSHRMELQGWLRQTGVFFDQFRADLRG
jgi:hypothetical protein